MNEPTAPPLPPQPRKSRRWPWIVGMLATFVLGLGLGSVAGDSEDDPVASPAVDATTESEPEAAVEEEAEPEPDPEPEPEFYEPTADDFALAIKELERQCFGSAGCNVTFRIELTSLYTGQLDPSKTYELTYEIEGGEDPLLNTLELTGEEYLTDSEERIGTASSDAELSAVVTDVSEY